MEYECKKCKVLMYENLLTTLKVYDSDTTTIFNEDGEIGEDLLPEYFVLECPLCKDIIKINFFEYFKNEQLDKMKRISKVRIGIASKCIDLEKNKEMLEKTHKDDRVDLAKQFDEARGLSYCGYCEGFYDGDGYCNNGVKEICIVRRRKHFV